MDDAHSDFYRRLRRRIKVWAEKEENRSYEWLEWLLLAPDLFHLLICLLTDSDVPKKEKVKVAAVMAYFISPVDLLPEALFGPTGFLDDIVLTAYALNGIVNRTDARIVKKYWAGESDVLMTIQTILENADRMIGSGLFRRLRKMIGS